jgi:iron complex outermembrane receptor protein
VPYDGIIDLGRFTPYDVAAVNVAKGYSSALYGPNTMGGAINIMTRQPTQPFEGEFTGGVFTGNGYETSLNLGGRHDRWFFQAGGSYVNQDYFPLSKKFTPVPAEDGGHRENSYHTDWKVSGKLAYTPNPTDEYAVGFIHQDGDKGTPPQTTAPRYWQWPQWNKQTVYVLSNTRIGGSSYVKPRLYYDTYDNTLNIFDDATYTTEKKSTSSTSIYHDYSYGGSVEAGTGRWPKNTLKGILHYKFDHHREFPDSTRKPTTSFVDEDAGISYGLEDTYHAAKQWDVQGGLSYDTRGTKKAVDTATGLAFPTGNFSSLNPEAGVFYMLNEASALHATVAHKSRFPSMKERYSYRMGSGLPNTHLGAETAMHYEVGHVGRLTPELTLTASLYLSRINDTIQQVFLSPTSTVSQFQNIGTSENRGIDVGLDWMILPRATVGASYGYLHQHTMTTLPKNSEPVKGTDAPPQSGSLHGDLRPLEWISVVPEIQYASWRYSFSDGKGTTRKVGGFTLANLKLAVRLPHRVAMSLGVQNLFDKNYMLQEGYPEAGRTWFAKARYNF